MKKKLIAIAIAIMTFSAFAVQATPIGAGSGGYIGSPGPGSELHSQDAKVTNNKAVAQNANFERLHGMGAATVATTNETDSQVTILANGDTSRGVLGGDSIGIGNAVA